MVQPVSSCDISDVSSHQPSEMLRFSTPLAMAFIRSFRRFVRSQGRVEPHVDALHEIAGNAHVVIFEEDNSTPESRLTPEGHDLPYQFLAGVVSAERAFGVDDRGDAATADFCFQLSARRPSPRREKASTNVSSSLELAVLVSRVVANSWPSRDPALRLPGNRPGGSSQQDRARVNRQVLREAVDRRKIFYISIMRAQRKILRYRIRNGVRHDDKLFLSELP